MIFEKSLEHFVDNKHKEHDVYEDLTVQTHCDTLKNKVIIYSRKLFRGNYKL